jgi:nitrate/nitrite transport system substrate-binding protein
MRLLLRPVAALLAITATASAATYEEYTPTATVINFQKAIDNKIEKTELTFGIIKLTDCIPIIAAKELGFFAAEGINVKVQVQPNWKAVNDRLISGEIDGTHMLYGHPLGAAIGYGAKAELVVPYNMCINGMGITVSNALWKDMAAKDPRLAEDGYAQPVKADPIKAIAADRKAAGKPALQMFMTFPAGSHNMNLRYWLAAGGVNPGFYEGLSDAKGVKDGEVVLTVNPPPQMAQAMAQGNCDAFCVGEPWNMQVTIKDKTGRIAIPSQYIFNGSPDKVFAMTKAFTEKNPNTTLAVTRALIRAGMWCDESAENRHKIAEILAAKEYIGAKPEILGESVSGTLVFGIKKDGSLDRRPEPDFNIFFKKGASYPQPGRMVWGLTQFRRWGMIPEAKADGWYKEVAEKVSGTAIYKKAFESLVAEGLAKAEDLPKDDYPTYPAEVFIDGIAFDPAKPNEYLSKFAIGLK